ncbi:sulfotransferase domain-containing protein [Zunongwangia sp. F363]|uniref:Sulfotransferase domain-containing protein n=1 Tax=Autumnicola tepida TaxID=3075595 RepID=A0ABU3CCX3_9FLAO|nr:sulfotransferase domain-containing protein [Zunongwangia sp. F363]MDT0644192.1 sulfotransferase domain-containing protein [Zunongwangia sp. F363]
MTTLQIGYPKSGNFWLYQILQRILEYNGQETSGFIQKHPIQNLAKDWELNYPEQSLIDMIDITDLQVSYRISSIFRMPVEDFSEYLKETSHVWTHSPVCKRSGDVFNRFEKKVYIIRDPRDVVISASKYFCSDYMQKYFPQEEKEPEKYLEKHFDRIMEEWVWHVWDHLRLSKKFNIHICFFEGFRGNFQEELCQLLDYLEVDLSKEQRQQLENAVSFKKLKQENPKHLRKGTSGYWKEQLSQYHKERAIQLAGPLLGHLGYSGIKNSGLNRNFSHWDFEALKEEIISARQPLV